MKATSLILILAVAALLIGCGSKTVQKTAPIENSPTAEADNIGNEINSNDLNTDDLDSLDQDLASVDADLDSF